MLYPRVHCWAVSVLAKCSTGPMSRRSLFSVLAFRCIRPYVIWITNWLGLRIFALPQCIPFNENPPA